LSNIKILRPEGAEDFKYPILCRLQHVLITEQGILINMFYLNRHTNQPVYGALIDISSGSIGVAIIVSDTNKKIPSLLYSHRVTMRITERMGERDENLRRIREALFSGLLQLSQEGLEALHVHNPKAKITKISVTCSSPWSYTVARTVHYEDSKPFEVSKTLINDLINSAEEEIISHVRDTTLLTKEGFAVVERATVDVTVNDYPISNPLGLTGTILGLSHVAGVIPKEIIESVKEAQDKLFPNTDLRIHTFMLVMYCVMRDMFPKLHSLCIIDITSEATEFGIVENNLLAENIFMLYGSNSFIRDIMSKTNMPASDILTRIQAYSDDKKMLDDVLSEHATMFISNAEKEFNEILSRRMIPSDIIISVQKPFIPFFKYTIEDALKNAGQTNVRVLVIDSSTMEEIEHNPDADTYLTLGARFFHKLHGCAESTE